MHDVSITYVGDESILTNPLYLKWSQLSLESVKAALTNIQSDLGTVEANMDNLKIIAYLSTLIRIAGLI